MGQLLHSCARTTASVRHAIQQSQETVSQLTARYETNPKTVAKWRKRTHLSDAPMGPKEKRSTGLTTSEEAMCVAFRGQTLLPLDDRLYSLQPRSASDTISLASAQSAPWHQPLAESPNRFPHKAVRNRVRSSRHRRGAHGRGQTLSVRRHRPHLQVCLCRVTRTLRSHGRHRLPATPDQSRSL